MKMKFMDLSLFFEGLNKEIFQGVIYLLKYFNKIKKFVKVFIPHTFTP